MDVAAQSKPAGFLPEQHRKLSDALEKLLVIRNTLSDNGFFPPPEGKDTAAAGGPQPPADTTLRTSFNERVDSICDLAQQIEQQVDRLFA